MFLLDSKSGMLGGTIGDKPGSRVSHRVAMAFGILVTENGKFQCPNSGEFTDPFGSTCGTSSPQAAAQKIVKGIKKTVEGVSKKDARDIFAGTASSETITKHLLKGTDYKAEKVDLPAYQREGISFLIVDNNDEALGTVVLSAGRSLDDEIDPDTVRLDLMELTFQEQGKGTARKVLENLIEVAEADGKKRISLEANIDVGGYAWGRLGFAPDAGGADDVIAYAVDLLEYRDPDGGYARELDWRDGTKVFRMSPQDVDLALDLLGDLLKKEGGEWVVDENVWRRLLGINGVAAILLGSAWAGHLRIEDNVAMTMFKRPSGAATTSAKKAGS